MIKLKAVIRMNFILAFLTVLMPFFVLSFRREEKMAWSVQSSFLFITRDKKQRDTSWAIIRGQKIMAT